MARWTVRNEVREATMDIWGRRTNTRTFVVWDTPIDEGTARRIAQMISGRADTIIHDSVTNAPMPGIGDAWSSEIELNDYAQMYLDHYDVQIQSQEIIAVAHYSTDAKFNSLEIGWTTQLTDIPYAVRLTTGVATAQAGGGLVKTWQFMNYRIPVCMPRLQVTGQVNMSQMGDLDTIISGGVNKLFWLTMLRSSPFLPVGSVGPTRLWKFEGANASQIGPDYCDVRYSFIADPGQVTIAWPQSFQATNPLSDFTVPSQSFTFAGQDWTRAPFHELKIIPPSYGPNELPTPQDPKRPTFAQIPITQGLAAGSTQSNPQINLAGVGLFPLATRRQRLF